jgi:transcriptional repressor NrdR
MYCPKCKNTDTQVYDTRTINNGKNIKRRRECLNCHFRFITLEDIKIVDIFVKKRNGQEVAFDIEKIKVGITKSFNKRKLNLDQINLISGEVLSKVMSNNLESDLETISTTRIGEIVLEVLREHDQAAYICYFAMFGNFSSGQDFINLIKQFEEKYDTTK